MPRTIEQGFDDFHLKLKPSTTESAAAAGHRASIETRLRNDFGLNRFVRIGSFGNGTSIYGFSDVDYLACLPSNQLTTSSTYSLTKIRDALAARFPNTGVHISCPAVVCPFGTNTAERTEVVPGDFRHEASGYKVYDIADCAGGWMEASPDAHNAYVRTIDAKLANRVKPLVRFLKACGYIRDVPISSFYLELRVAKYAYQETSIIHEYDVKRVLAQLWDCQLANIQDPMGISGYIPACKTSNAKVDALSKLATAVTRAEKARDAASKGDISSAFYWWRLLYDDWFPTYYF